MSCWVVPTVAAELWGMPLNAVLEQIREGRIASKTELGFVLVDVAPGSAQSEPKIRAPKPLTYMSIEPTQSVLTRAEIDALLEDDSEEPPVDDEASEELAEWRQVRANVARQRRRPAAIAA